jgi:hypothetical protein
MILYAESAGGRLMEVLVCSGKGIVSGGWGILRDFDGITEIAPAWEVPLVGKSSALEWFGCLDAAVPSIEEDAGAVGLVGEGESVAARAQASELLDEIDF